MAASFTSVGLLSTADTITRQCGKFSTTESLSRREVNLGHYQQLCAQGIWGTIALGVKCECSFPPFFGFVVTVSLHMPLLFHWMSWHVAGVQISVLRAQFDKFHRLALQVPFEVLGSSPQGFVLLVELLAHHLSAIVW